MGQKIVETLLEGYDDFNILLYTSPGKESFYQKFGFRSAKTGMARFLDPDQMEKIGHL